MQPLFKASFERKEKGGNRLRNSAKPGGPRHSWQVINMKWRTLKIFKLLTLAFWFYFFGPSIISFVHYLLDLAEVLVSPMLCPRLRLYTYYERRIHLAMICRSGVLGRPRCTNLNFVWLAIGPIIFEDHFLISLTKISLRFCLVMSQIHIAMSPEYPLNAFDFMRINANKNSGF